MQKREEWLDYIKAFAIICVVIGHACERTMTGINTQSFLIRYLDFFVNSFHMPLFFMVSGYIYKNAKEAGKDAQFLPYLKKKAIDLLFPYTWFAIAIWIGKSVFSDYVVRKVETASLFEMFIEPVAFMWFIYLLFFISIFIWVLEKVLKDNSIIILIILIPMTMTWIWFKSGNVLIDRFLFYSLFYYIGVCIYKFQWLLRKWIIAAVAFILYVILFIPYCNNPDIYAYKIMENLTGAFFFFFLLHGIIEYFSLGNQALLYIGKNTMYIYIMHPVLMNAFRMFYIKINFHNTIIWLMSLILCGIALPVSFSLMAKDRLLLEFWFKPRIYIERFEKKRRGIK
ncbi:MAG: acyltransferase family protein [Coprococcus sp.]|nr:acyltransferase family protein [Coprococcus sp.]